VIRLPCIRFIAASLILFDDIEQCKEFLVQNYVPLPPDDKLQKLNEVVKGSSKRLTKTQKIKLLKEKKMPEFARYFIKGEIDMEPDFDELLHVQQSFNIRIPLQAFLMTKDPDMLKLSPFEVSEKTRELYKFYLFDIEKMRLKDWIVYLKLLYELFPTDAKLLLMLKKGETFLFKRHFKHYLKISMDDVNMELNSTAVTVFRLLSEQIIKQDEYGNLYLEMKPEVFREARLWANLLINSMKVFREQLTGEQIPEKVELVPHEYDIPTLKRLIDGK